MTNAFTKGMAASLPSAKLTFDKFHVVSLVNNAVDEVRRLERKDHPELGGSRYVWLKNPEKVTPGQWETFDALDIANSHLKTARAYQIRFTFQDLFNQPADKAKSFLDQWYFRATHSRIPAMVEVAQKSSVATRTASSAGSLPASTTEYSKASTAWSRPPRPKPAAIAQIATLPPSFTSSQANSIFRAYPPETAKNRFLPVCVRGELLCLR